MKTDSPGLGGPGGGKAEAVSGTWLITSGRKANNAGRMTRAIRKQTVLKSGVMNCHRKAGA